MTDDGMINRIAGALRDWIPEQRWFAGKGRPVLAVTPVHTAVLGGGDPQLVLAVVDADQGAGYRERYQLLLGLRRYIPEYLGHAWVAAPGDRVAYQAIHDPELTTLLLTLMRDGKEVNGVRFATEPGVVLDTGQRSRPVGAEQSNTSLVYGHRYILKLFRKLVAGRNPDLELHRALAEVGCAHIAAPLGSIEGELDGEVVTYGMLTGFLPNTADGWAMATASVRDLLATDFSPTDAPPHPDEVGGDFASEARRLGQAVATVHADLARAFGRSEAGDGHLDRLADAMHRRLEAVRTEVPELAEHVNAVRSAFDDLREVSHPVLLQRLHGDLHLGQALRHVTGWVLIDFEGEPATPLAERRAPSSPLRDVAGMLRSFDYAADHMPLGDIDPQQHAAVALEWALRNRDAFCDGYAEVTDDPREQAVLLRAFELDKAVYEVAYEHGNRPGWLPIPLASIARITAGAQAGDR